MNSNPATIITEPTKNLNDTMIAVEWHGSTDIRINTKRKRPVLTVSRIKINPLGLSKITRV